MKLKSPNRLSDFALAVRAAAYNMDRDIRAAADTYGTTYSPVDGGYAVAPAFVNDIYMHTEGALLPFCDVVPVSSGNVGIPTDGTVPWETSGIRCGWIDEGTEGEASKPHLSMQGFNLKKLLSLVPLTEELAEDAPALAAWLPQAMGRAVTWTANDSIINGTGAARFLGILNAPSLITVSKESAQATGTIADANIAKMMGRCLDVDGARWIMNPDAFAQVLLLELYDAPTKTLGGLPVTLTEASPAIGAKGDIILANLSGYRVASRGEQLANSTHMYFDRDLVAYRLTTRLDGAPILSKPTIPPNSTNTRSHFVTLEERA